MNRRHPVGFAAVLLNEHGINRLRVEAAKDLLDEGARCVDETGREPIGGAKLLLAVQGTRATHIFESVIALCSAGRGVPASMLNRALLEEALDVHWVAANPEEAPVLADKHERLIELAERQNEVRFGREAEPLTDEEKQEFSALRREYDNFNAPWTLASNNDRIALIKERWGADAGRHIDFIYEVVQRQNNVLLHSSPIGYALAMTPGRRQPNRIGPDPRWREALGHGALAYYFICRIIADEFGLDRTELERLFERVTVFVKKIADADLDAARGGDCPCGSGVPTEECHAS